MLRATILSEPGSGSTTFVGLLYLAQTRMATERAEVFRFSSPPESIQRLAPLFERLVAGEFPPSMAPEEAVRIRFEMGFCPPGRWSRFRRGTSFEPRHRAECRWAHAPFGGMLRALQTGGSEPGVPPDLRSCTAPIFVLDPRPPEGSTDAIAGTSVSRDDAVVAILRELAPRGGGSGAAAGGALHPTFVFTKADEWPSDTAPTLQRAKLIDEEYLVAEGPHIGTTLLEAWLPRAAAFCRSGVAGTGEPATVLSYVQRTPGDSGGPDRIQTRTLPDHRHEPVYPFPLFRGLIDRLGELASRAP